MKLLRGGRLAGATIIEFSLEISRAAQKAKTKIACL
jgi:hypothetical protein